MKRADWSAAADPETVKRRAAGRRHYNACRAFARDVRRCRLLHVLRKSDLNIYDRGTRAKLARILRVHRSTITRDLAALFRGRNDPCRCCGRFSHTSDPENLDEPALDELGLTDPDELPRPDVNLADLDGIDHAELASPPPEDAYTRFRRRFANNPDLPPDSYPPADPDPLRAIELATMRALLAMPPLDPATLDTPAPPDLPDLDPAALDVPDLDLPDLDPSPLA